MSEMVVREIEKEQRLAEQKAQSAMSNHLLRAIDCFTWVTYNLAVWCLW